MGLDYSMQLVMSGILNITQLVGVASSLWVSSSHLASNSHLSNTIAVDDGQIWETTFAPYWQRLHDSITRHYRLLGRQVRL